jgi:MFS family permease
MVPQLLLGIWAGVLADRMDKRKILLVTKSITLLVHLTTAILILSGAIEAWMVFVTTFVAGASMAFDQPARQSMIPRLVPREVLANAIALNSAAMNVMRIGGPSLAGLILAFADYGLLYLFQATIYLTVIYCTFLIVVPKDAARRESSSMRAELLEGFAAVKQDRAIFYILILSLILFVWGFPYQSVSVPLIAVESLDIGKSGTGLLVSVTGIGALVGSLTVATIGDTVKRRGLIMLCQIILYSVMLILFSRANLVSLAALTLIGAGALQTSFMSLNNAFVLSRTPPELHGRVMSLFSLDRGLIPLGGALAGLLAEELGPQDGLLIMAVICLGCTLALALLVPSLRRIS